MKRTMYLAAWKSIQVEGSEFRQLYEKLVPRKCRYDERLGRYVGRERVLGRIVGQLISVIYALLKREELALRAARSGHAITEPELYDPARHHSDRSGAYARTATRAAESFVGLPTLQSPHEPI
jgi:hypothetical protein